MSDFDTLFDLLKIRYKDDADPSRSAYRYLAQLFRVHVPKDAMKFYIETNEKAIIIDTLKA